MSFTSFSLVYGTAVLTVEVHDGLEINLLGLARHRPAQPGVADGPIELALQARFSTAGGRVLGPGPADRQLVADQRGLPAHRRVRLRHVVQGPSWPASSWSASAATTRTSSSRPRFPVGAPRRLRLGAGCRRVDQGRRLLRPDRDVRDGRWLAGGVVQELDRLGQPGGRRPHPRVVGPVLLRLQGLHPDLGRHRHRGLLLRLRPGADELLVQRRGAHARDRSCAARSRSTSTWHVRDDPVRTVRGDELRQPTSFAAFRDKYLRSGDDDGHVLAASITAGRLPATATTTASGAGSGEQGTADDGTAGRPWRVAPEFSFIVQTRAATNAVTGVAVPSNVTGRQLDLGPAHRTNVVQSIRGHRGRDQRRDGGVRPGARPRQGPGGDVDRAADEDRTRCCGHRLRRRSDARRPGRSGFRQHHGRDRADRDQQGRQTAAVRRRAAGGERRAGSSVRSATSAAGSRRSSRRRRTCSPRWEP